MKDYSKLHERFKPDYPEMVLLTEVMQDYIARNIQVEKALRILDELERLSEKACVVEKQP